MAMATLALVVWLAWFSGSRGFGFYEDDYSTITPHLYGTWTSTLHQVSVDVGSFRQGKPLCYALMSILARIAGTLGGKDAAYGLAFLILTLNASLGFWFLRRIRLGLGFALVGAMTFALAPADTSRAFLCHAFGIQMGFCFLWLALHAYVSRKKAIAWALAIAALLTYEPLFALFWIGGFVVEVPKRERFKQVVRQALGIGLVLVLFAGLRLSCGESRLVNQSPLRVPRKMARNLILGPTSAVGAWAERAGTGFKDPARWALFALLSVALVAAFRHSEPSSRTAVQIAFLGVLLVGLAYPVDLINEPTLVSGRASRIHSAGAMGLSFLFMALFVWLHSLMRRGQRLALTCVVAWVFSGWIGYGRKVQADYRGAWKSQQMIWASVSEQIPDATQKDVVLLDFDKRQPRYQEAKVFGWSFPMVASQLFKYPKGLGAPNVRRVKRGWQKGSIPENAIVLHWEKNGFRRLKPGEVGAATIKARGNVVRRAPRPFLSVLFE